MRRDSTTKLLMQKRAEAMAENPGSTAPDWAGAAKWPMTCTVGPGLEGAIACESGIGYVNGSKGALIYRGYDIFDLCAHSTYEEVAYLLLYGRLPSREQYVQFKARLVQYRHLPNTLRRLMSFPMEDLHPMAGLRMGVEFMRQRLTWRDIEAARPDSEDAIAADEDSIPMEQAPYGEQHAIYEFKRSRHPRPDGARKVTDDASTIDTCLHLISGVATISAAVARVRRDQLPIAPDPTLGHAANLLYMMNGRRPTREEERMMDVALILHADHGMNASTFASMVVASTLSDIYMSVGAGIAALSGPLHGGANEAVINMLNEIGDPSRVEAWFEKARREKRKIMGMGHRVYKAYDPRARILAPLAERLAARNKDGARLLATAKRLEEVTRATLGQDKKVFPNVDFYSGIVYSCLEIEPSMFTPMFAVSRVAGWVARINEYLRNNRIFRPRAVYVGPFDLTYTPMAQRRSGTPRGGKKPE